MLHGQPSLAAVRSAADPGDGGARGDGAAPDAGQGDVVTAPAAARATRATLVAALTVGLVLLNPPMPYVLAHSEAGAKAVLDSLEEALGALRAIRSSIDRTAFDADALGSALAFEEPADIVAWVREHVGFEAYAGVLRGPDGTLMARAGNAFDQAVLLAKLLRDAGYEAKVVEGTLSREDAALLLTGLWEPPPASAPAVDRPELAEAIATLRRLGFDGDGLAALEGVLRGDPPRLDGELSIELSESARAQAERIRRLLEDAGRLPAPGADGHDLVAEAQGYAWVEYRLAADDPWETAHPAFTAGVELVPVDRAREFTDTVPGDLLHTVRIESEVVVETGGSTRSVPVMAPWERPAANLAGLAVTYANLPDSLLASLETPMQLEDLEATTTFLFPTLLGGLPDGAQAFTRSGFTVPPDAATSPQAGVFETAAEKGGRAAGAIGALGGSGRQDAPQVLRRQLLRFTVTSPDGEERVAERVIAELDGDEERFFADLTQVVTLMVDVGGVPDAYVLDRYLEKLISLEPVLRWSVAVRDDPALPPPASGVDGPVDFATIDQLLLFAAFSAPATVAGGERTASYRQAPAVVVHQRWGVVGDEVAAAVDVVSNPRRVVGAGPDSRATLLPAEIIEAGVWETHVEGLVLDGFPEGQFNTMAAIARAEQAGAELVVLVPGEDTAEAIVGISDQTRAAIERDLASGYLVVVPDVFPAEETLVGWWRVDSEGWETLGVISDGRGAAVPEWLLDLAGNIGALGFMAGFLCLMDHAFGARYPLGAERHSVLSCVGLAVGGAASAAAALGYGLVATIAAMVAGVIKLVGFVSAAPVGTPVERRAALPASWFPRAAVVNLPARST